MRLNKNYFNHILVSEINFTVVVCSKCNISVDRKTLLFLLKTLAMLRSALDHHSLSLLTIVNIIGRNSFGAVFN